MSEQNTNSSQDDRSALLSAPATIQAGTSAEKPPQSSRHDILAWLCALGFVVLAAAIVYLWQWRETPGQQAARAAELRAVQARLATLDARIAQVAQAPESGVAKLSARVDVLDGKLASQVALASQLDALSGRIQALSGSNQTGQDALRQQIDALTQRVAALEAQAHSVQTLAERLNRIARLQEASFALQSGQKLGDVPGAPPAVARYADMAPPTLEQLRLRFQAARRAALAAKQPEAGSLPLMRRVLARAETLVTIQRGNTVLVGSPTAAALAQAQAALDQGDLAGAVAAVSGLQGDPAQAVAGWLADARHVLAARQALTAMAGQG